MSTEQQNGCLQTYLLPGRHIGRKPVSEKPKVLSLHGENEEAKARERKTEGFELARHSRRNEKWENVCFVQGTAWQIEKMEGKVSAWSRMR